MATRRKKVKVPMYKKPQRVKKNAGGAATNDSEYLQNLYAEAKTAGFTGTYEQWYQNWLSEMSARFSGAGFGGLNINVSGSRTGTTTPFIGGGGGAGDAGGAGTTDATTSRVGAPLQSINPLGPGYDPAYGRVEQPTRPVIQQVQPAEYTTTLNKSEEELEEESRTGKAKGGRLRAFVGGNIDRSAITPGLKELIRTKGAEFEAAEKAAQEAAKAYDTWAQQNNPYYGQNVATITNVRRNDLISGTPEDQAYLQGAYYSRFYSQQQAGQSNPFTEDNVAYRNYTEDFGEFNQQDYDAWVESVYGTAPHQVSSSFSFSEGGSVIQDGPITVRTDEEGKHVITVVDPKTGVGFSGSPASFGYSGPSETYSPEVEAASPFAGLSLLEKSNYANGGTVRQKAFTGFYRPSTNTTQGTTATANSSASSQFGNLLGTTTAVQEGEYVPKTQDQLDAENITPVNDAVTEYESGTTTGGSSDSSGDFTFGGSGTNNNGGEDDNPLDTSNGGGTSEAGPTGEGGGYVPEGNVVGDGTDPGATDATVPTAPADQTTAHAAYSAGELGVDPDDADATYTNVQQAAAPTVSGDYSRTATADQTYTAATAKEGKATTADLGSGAEASTYDAVTVSDQVGEVDAAQGRLSEGATAEVDEARLTERAQAAQRDAEAEQVAQATAAQYDISEDAYINEVIGETAKVSETPEAEAAQREAITGKPATEGQAAQIVDKIGYEAAKMRTVKGSAAKGEAAEMVAAVGNLPSEISAVIVEDPATVEAAIDDEPIEVRAAVAALPTEALVSSQMETLLAGMEDGNIPAWARPAVDAVTQSMARRGLDTSTIARDALFNAIITSAMPMAQSNAQALQERAAQNLSNEQQANIQQANLEAQRRLSNTANRQTAGSQTAQMAQQMSAMQSQFAQDARFTSAAQQQQMRMQNLQNQQQAAVQNVQNQQAMNAQNLGNEQQMELANLQYEFNTNAANMSAENQARMQEMQVAADFLAKNAGFKQQMEMANLSNAQQMRLANLSALNQASSENLSAEQQTELANLNARMQTNLLQGEIASKMNLAQLSVDQQRAVSNAAMVANMDMSQFNADQQVALANSQFMQSMTMANFNAEQQAAMQNATALASLDLANLDTRTKLAAQNAQAFLQMDMANLSNEQQAVMLEAQMQQQALLSDQSMQNAARQFNAQSQTQVDQFNTSLHAQIRQFNAQQQNAMEQFNASEANRLATTDMQLQAQLRSTELQSSTNLLAAEVRAESVADVTNAQLQAARDQFNAQNQFVAEQAAIDYSRKINTLNTAAENEMIKLNAQQNFQLTAMEYEAELLAARDTANFLRTDYMTDKQLKTNLYIAAIGNETAASKESSTNINTLMGFVDGLLGS